MDNEDWSSNLSKISTVFISLGFDLSQLRDKQGLILFHKIIQIVQQVLYQNEGSLNKLLMDDKGTTLIAIYGCQPNIHQNDSSRAVSAALDMSHHLKRVKINVNIGITTSRVFAGVVGTSGGRREYSLLGDGVNLAARLMQLACTSQGHNIFLDEDTYIECSNRMECAFHNEVKVKGKDKKIRVYYPKNKYRICLTGNYRERKPEQKKNLVKKFLNSLNDFRVNIILPRTSDLEIFEMFMMERDQNYTKGIYEMIGREEESKQLFNQLELFYGKLKAKNHCIVIKGEDGSGKTFFLKECLTQFRKMENYPKYSLFYNSITTGEFKYPYNSIRHLYGKVISLARQQTKMENFSEYSYVKDICLKSYEGNSYALKVIHQELKTFLNLISVFQQKEIYISKTRNEISHRTRECGKFVFSTLFYHFKKNFSEIGYESIIFVFDHANLIDKESIEILKFLLVSQKGIFFIFLYKSSFFQQKGIFSSPRHFCNYFFEAGISGTVIELKRLRKKKSNRLVEICFKAKYSGYEIKISDKIKNYVFERCKGNCKDTFYLIDSLIENKHIRPKYEKMGISIENFLDEKIAEDLEFELSEELEVSMKIDRFNKFIVSPISFENKYRSKLNKISPELSLVINIAAVIGDIFDDNIIKKINIFSQFSDKNLTIFLQRLINLEFIEVIGIKHDKKIFRFTHPFLRRLIYERMLFEHRRSLHKVYLEFLRVNPMPSYLWASKSQIKDSVIEEHLEYHFVKSQRDLKEGDLKVLYIPI